MTSAKEALGPASIVKGRIINVDVKRFTVDVETDKSQQIYYGIPVAGLYMSPMHGAGAYHMPEVDSKCFVFLCADGSKFVLGFSIDNSPKKAESEATSDDDFGPDHAGEREPLEPGDIYLGTADDNRVIIRKGGIVQIGSTGLSQRIYLPVENMVRDYFQRYHAISPLGEIEWGHATLIADENPSSGAGSLEFSDYFLEDGKENKLSFIEQTPVLVRYNIKDLCQEDVTKGKYSVEVRMGRLTTETLDPEEDIEHVFAQELYKVGDKRAENPVRSSLSDEGGTGIRSEEKGILSCTIYCHDEGANKDKVTYAFQVNRDGDNFIFSRGHTHVEIAETVYANIHKGAKIEYGDKGVSGKQSVIELLQSNELRTQLKAIVHEVLDDMEVDATNIKLNATGEVHLGEGADDFVVRLNALETFLKTGFSCTTAFGPSGPMTTPFAPDVGSTKVKVNK
tara:strand:- start:14441 stop:15796 length:1356 start_codon:yes stop_codon:yes gene_type:complete